MCKGDDRKERYRLAGIEEEPYVRNLSNIDCFDRSFAYLCANNRHRQFLWHRTKLFDKKSTRLVGTLPSKNRHGNDENNAKVL